MSVGYRIEDEPSPSSLSGWAVRPFWPLLAQMVGGAWLAWPWFVLNAIALGSATRRREHLLVAVAAIGSIVLSALVSSLVQVGALGGWVAPYAAVALVTFKLGIAYWVHTLQQRTCALYEYFGHPVRNGIALVIVGSIVRQMLIASDLPLFLLLVLA